MEPPNKPTRPSTPKHQEEGILVKVAQPVNSEPMARPAEGGGRGDWGGESAPEPYPRGSSGLTKTLLSKIFFF